MQKQKLVDIDTGVLRRNRVSVLNTPGAVLFLDFGPRSQWLRRLAIAQGLAKSFNPDEPRVPSGSGHASGEWMGDGGATADARAGSVRADSGCVSAGRRSPVRSRGLRQPVAAWPANRDSYR